MLELSETPDAGQAASRPTPSADGLDAAVRSIVLQNFKYWWTQNNQGRRAGDAVSRMWNAYPFGALLIDESWAWWSVSQVMSDGPLQARQAGALQGLVVASSTEGVAVLDWPDGVCQPSTMVLIPNQTRLDAQNGKSVGNGFNREGAQELSPMDFIEIHGFDQIANVLSCAYVHSELTRSVPGQLNHDGHHPGAGAGTGTFAVGQPLKSADETSAGMPSHAGVAGYRSRRAPTGKARAVLSRSHESLQCA